MFLIAAIGIAEKAEKTSRQNDPEFIIIDETLGMWVSLIFLWRTDITTIIAGLLIFRLLDTIKFFPISLFELFRGGIGIIGDDLAAGMLTNIILRFILILGII